MVLPTRKHDKSFNPKFNNQPQFDLKAFRKIAIMPTKDFHPYGQKVKTPQGTYFYKDNGSNVLAVAHLDTVRNRNYGGVVNIAGDTRIYTTSADDRWGAYIILKVLPALGINVDVLLTEGEEKMNSTARQFIVPKGKKYNWIFSFDREGDISTVYQYKSPSFLQALSHANIKLGVGSYSDIKELEALGCCGINFGAGYYNRHSEEAYIRVRVAKEMISNFRDFYIENKDVKFPYQPRFNTITKYGFGYSAYYNEFFSSEKELALAEEILTKLQSNVPVHITPNVTATYVTIADIRRMLNETPVSNIYDINTKSSIIGPSELGEPKDLVLPRIEEIRKYSRERNISKSEKNKIEIIDHLSPQGLKPDDIIKRNTKMGLNSIVVQKCIACGIYVNVTNDETPLCDKHKKENAESEQKMFEGDPSIAKELHEDQPMTLGLTGDTKVDAIVHSLKNEPNLMKVAAALKALRLSVPENAAKNAFNELVKDKFLKKSSDLCNWPKPARGEKIVITQRAAAALLKQKADEPTLGIKGEKWISKIENFDDMAYGFCEVALDGKRTVSEYPENFERVKLYADAYNDLVEESYKDVILAITELKLQDITPDKYLNGYEKKITVYGRTSYTSGKSFSPSNETIKEEDKIATTEVMLLPEKTSTKEIPLEEVKPSVYKFPLDLKSVGEYKLIKQQREKEIKSDTLVTYEWTQTKKEVKEKV